MKKRNIFLMILIPIFLIGIACILIGIALGGTLYSYQLRSDESDGEYQTGTATLTSAEAEAVRGIDWNIRTSDVTLVNGDSYGISGAGRYRSYVKDGIWYLKTEKKMARITFFNHHIEIPWNWNWGIHWNDDSDNDFNKNTITIPADLSLESATIRVAAGELTGGELCADNVSLKTGAGSCTLEQITAKELSVKVGAGSSTLRRLQVSGSCNAKVGAGDLVLGSKKIPAGVNSISNLHGKCSAGDLTVTGKLTGDARLKCSVGNIDVLLDGYRSNYNIDSEGSLGDIDIKRDGTDDDWDMSDDDDDDDDDDIDDDDYGYSHSEYHNNGHDNDHHQPAVMNTPDVSGGKDQPAPTPASDTENRNGDGDGARHGNLFLKCSLGNITVKFQH